MVVFSLGEVYERISPIQPQMERVVPTHAAPTQVASIQKICSKPIQI